jgi:predicted ATPase
VIIGENGSGKSNLIEAFELLRNVPGNPRQVIREGGAVRDWIWKGSGSDSMATVGCSIESRSNHPGLDYAFTFAEIDLRFEIVEEHLQEIHRNDLAKPQTFISVQNGNAIIADKGEGKQIPRSQLDPQRSIIALRRDPDHYPQLAALGDFFEKIRVYREWGFGRNSSVRQAQPSDFPSHWMEPDCSNLGMVLSNIRRNPDAKENVLKALQELYSGIEDFDVQIDPGLIQVYLIERRKPILASRLSDGTLRYLCLLAILYHPSPPPVICIEEPELGLHPDIIPSLAQHLKQAAERCQLIVTTHSESLVDAFTDQPESILVCERHVTGTSLTRLEAKPLKKWLKRYGLGQLWMKGEIGGTRW